MKSKQHQQPRRCIQLAVEALEDRSVPSATPYLVPTAAGVSTSALLTVGDSVPDGEGGQYRMVGIPDGLGAFDNGDGTFTVLMNHELPSGSGVVRDHGSRGAFVSRFIIDRATLSVLAGNDLIQSVQLWDGTTYVAGTTAFNRFCSADLAEPSAFFNAETGLGTDVRLYLNGEETTAGRAFAHIATGPNAGTSYELPGLGKYAFENVVASPFAQDLTIVVGLDDSSRNFSSEGASNPSEVYFYIGAKQATGVEVEQAGLVGGSLFGLKIPGAADETQLTSGDSFTLELLGDVSNTSAATLQTDSIAAGVTQFRRVEDGHWDPNNPNDFYFVTTDGFGGSARLWRLRFEDVNDPTAGGTIEILVDTGVTAGEMFDNMTIDSLGRVVIQEDPGNQAYLARVWMYDIASGALVEVARHNADLFVSGSPDFITQDEESSGVIDISHILGPGHYLLDVQAHKNISATEPELVEMGQLLVMKTGVIAGLGYEAATNEPALVVLGTGGNDHIKVTQTGSEFAVRAGDTDLVTLASAVEHIFAVGYAGNDHLDLSGVQTNASIHGGAGNDHLTGGSGADYLGGGAGNDKLDGGPDSDHLEGGAGNDSFPFDPADVLLDFGLGKDHKKKK